MTFLSRWIPALVADVVGVGLAFLLLPWLRVRFQAFSFSNTVIIGAVFLVFCVSVYALKKYAGDVLDGLRFSLFFDRRVLGAIGVFFALTLMMATAYVSGFLDSVVDINRGMLDEPSITIYLLLTPASWLGLALIYMLLLTMETEPVHEPGTGRLLLVSLLALSGVNLMAVTTTGVWQAIWSRFQAPADAGPLILLILLLNLLLYLPPRLIYALRGGGLASLLTLIPFLAYLSVLSLG